MRIFGVEEVHASIDLITNHKYTLKLHTVNIGTNLSSIKLKVDFPHQLTAPIIYTHVILNGALIIRLIRFYNTKRICNYCRNIYLDDLCDLRLYAYWYLYT